MNDAAHPPAWAVLEEALSNRRPVRARYHGDDRVLCPHALGWKNGRAKALCYQAAGPTSNSQDPRQRWRSLFIDEIDDAAITTDTAWHTTDNYSLAASNCIDHLEIAVPPLNRSTH